MTPHRINKIHSEAPKYLQERGFDVFRGKGKTDKSLEIKEYKAEKLQAKIEDLENKMEAITDTHKSNIEQLKQSQEKVKNQFNSIKKASESLSKLEEHTKGVLGKLDKIEVKKGLLGGKLTISEQDYSILVNLAKLGESKALENLQLKSKVGDLQQKLEKKGLAEHQKDIEFQRLKGIDIKYYELERKYKNLNITFERVETALNNLDLVEPINAELKAIKLAEKSMKKSFDMER
jgi:chromosome segregation ATPase